MTSFGFSASGRRACLIEWTAAAPALSSTTAPPEATAPAGLPDTGPALWPLAAGIALTVAGGAAAPAARRRHT